MKICKRKYPDVCITYVWKYVLLCTRMDLSICLWVCKDVLGLEVQPGVGPCANTCIRSKNTFTETCMSGKWCLKYHERGFLSRRSRWNHRFDCKKKSSSPYLHILMPSRNQIQPDPAAQHTHDCLLGRRERVTVRAGLAIPRRPQQEQPCWLFGSCLAVIRYIYI